MNQEAADKPATMDTKVEEKANGEVPKEIQSPTWVIVFDLKNPMKFRAEPLFGANDQQLLWAVHYLYHSLMHKQEREWTKELNRSESIADRLRKFGGKFKRK